ncbi:hypothetical protein PENTCL1PPCAC_5669, partial [Pristionchus entomophagus]
EQDAFAEQIWRNNEDGTFSIESPGEPTRVVYVSEKEEEVAENESGTECGNSSETHNEGSDPTELQDFFQDPFTLAEDDYEDEETDLTSASAPQADDRPSVSVAPGGSIAIPHLVRETDYLIFLKNFPVPVVFSGFLPYSTDYGIHQEGAQTGENGESSGGNQGCAH